MTTSQPFNHNIISHISPQKQVLHSSLDLKRLTLRRSHPKFIEFRLEDSVKTNTHPMKKLMTSISKTAFKLRNPPTKAAISNGSLTRHLRGLEVRPEPAEKYITDITRRFSKLKHFAILDEQDAFVPMRIKKKVHPIRTLKSFVYDHEFCQDFIRCARYASELKIRKTSLDLNHLKRLQRLEKMHLILKTKYLSLPEEDVKFRDDLAKILLKLPIFGRIILEQEVDPETCPYTFMELQKALKEKTRTHLIADFIDVSSQRNKNIDLEKMLQTINEFGIESLKVGYVGIAQAMNRYGRSFYAPLHIKPELYSRFLKALMNTPFKNVEFAPIVHSSYADADLNNALKEFVRSKSKINVPKISMIYNLDMMEFENIHLMSDLYAQGASAYEVTVSSTTILRKGLPEKLEEHFCEGFKRIDMTNSSLSLHVVAKNNDILGKLTNIIASGVKTVDLKAVGIQIQEPIGKNTLPNILELVSGSGAFKLVKEINVEFTERSMPNSEDLSSFLRGMLEIPKNLNKLSLTYHNTEEAEEVLKKVFEGLRSVNLKTELEYQINDESSMNE